MKKDIIEQLNNIDEELNNIVVSIETINDYNKLTSEKLNQLDDLDIYQDKKDLFLKVWDLKRYSECYVTLNSAITKEIDKVNESLKTITDDLREVTKACKNDKK